MKGTIQDFFKEDIRVKQESIEALTEKIMELAALFEKTFNDGHKIIVFGNGGCAGIAQQMTAAFTGRFKSGKTARPVLCLCADASHITTLSNDYGFENIFVKQLEAFLKEGDVVVGLSTSGNSANVVKGMEYAKEKGAFTIGFTGEKGGKLNSIADFLLKVPSTQPSHIESTFSVVNALLCKLID